MLRHIVMHRFKPTVSQEERLSLKAAIEKFADHPEVLSLTCGMNVGSGPNHYDFATVADFEDIEAFRRYLASDMHAAYVEEHAKSKVDTLAAIQHEF